MMSDWKDQLAAYIHVACLEVFFELIINDFVCMTNKLKHAFFHRKFYCHFRTLSNPKFTRSFKKSATLPTRISRELLIDHGKIYRVGQKK
jgi:hypothetical protein